MPHWVKNFQAKPMGEVAEYNGAKGKASPAGLPPQAQGSLVPFPLDGAFFKYLKQITG
jgi:hypothetical protein